MSIEEIAFGEVSSRLFTPVVSTVAIGALAVVWYKALIDYANPASPPRNPPPPRESEHGARE